MNRARGGIVLVVAVGLMLGGCGDDDDLDAGSASTITTIEPASTSAVTSAPETTASTTSTTTTRPATTSEPATSTSAGTEPGTWEEIDVDDLPAWAFPPCCADTWKAPGPSPELPAEGEPLADGVYFANIAAWSPTTPDQVTLTISRFERCDRLLELGYENECDPMWAPDNVAVVPEPGIQRDFPLDASFAAGVTGTECPNGIDFVGRSFAGDGSALATMWSELEADYDEWVRGPLEAGTDAQVLAEQLAADPASPFTAFCGGGPGGGAGGGLLWTAEGGPIVLFQSLPIYDLEQDAVVPRAPEDLLSPAALEVRDGTPILYLYQGFVS